MAVWYSTFGQYLVTRSGRRTAMDTSAPPALSQPDVACPCVSHTFMMLSLWFSFGASAVILMYDVENRVSYRNLPHWRTEVLRTCTSQRLPQQKDCLMLLVGNKVDSRERKVPAKAVLFHRKVNMDYFEISVAANYNLDKPFVHLLKKLMDKPDLALVESPAYGPPSKAFDPRETEEALARAAATVFVESEDE